MHPTPQRTAIFYDTETTGFPSKKKPKGDESQPHATQIAAIQVDMDTRREIQIMDFTIYPDNFEIPEKTSAIHGISTEYAQAIGMNESLAVNAFASLAYASGEVIAYNAPFDEQIISIASHRNGNLSWFLEYWDGGAIKQTCSMAMAKEYFGVSSIKLIDAYERVTGKKMDNAHNALADVRGMIEVYWAMVDGGYGNG